MTALAALLLACGPQAHEPGATDLATVSAIVDQLAASNDPRREFSELPSETRQAVVEYLQVEKTENAGISGPATPIGAPARCERQESGYVARNAHGRDLWTYLSSTEWCWADGQITTTPIFAISAEVHAPLWEFAGNTEREESGRQGEVSHSDAAEGHFQLCPEGPDDCVQDEYVRVTKSQDGRGGSSANMWTIDRSRERRYGSLSQRYLPPLLVFIPLTATPLIAGWIMRRRSARGSESWGLGVITTALGVLVAGYAVLWTTAWVSLSIGSLFGSGSTSVSTTRSIEWVEVTDIPIEQTAVVPIETPAAGAQPGDATPAAGPAESPPRPDECGDQEVALTARNLFGQSLWSYRSGTWWCWDGAEITDEPRVSTWTLSRGPFWNLVDENTDESGGRGGWTHTDTVYLTFELCVPLLGCTQQDYQWLQKSQNADGTSAVDDLPRQDLYPAALFSLIGPLVVALTLLVVGRILRRGSQAGALAWGFGVIATSAGSLMLVLIVVTSLFFLSASHSVA